MEQRKNKKLLQFVLVCCFSFLCLSRWKLEVNAVGEEKKNKVLNNENINERKIKLV